MADRTLTWFWTRVATATRVPARSLGVFRWVLGAYLLLFDARYFAWMDRTPDAFFDPPLVSLPYLVGGFPPAPFFTALDVLGIVALCTMTIGYRTRASTTVVLVTYVVSSSFSYSHGKISHQVLVAVVLLCMIVADWGKAPSRQVDRGLALLAIAIAFGFLTAGLEKARYWVSTDLSSSGFLSWYYPRMFTYEDPQALAGLVPGTPLGVLKLADLAAVVVESTGFLALLGGRVPWRAWLLVITGLHLANALVLNITFTTQAVVYLAFANLLVLARPGLARLRVPAVVGVVAVGAWHVGTRVAGGGSSYFLGDGGRWAYAYDVYLCVVVCLVVMVLLAADLLRETRPLLAAVAARRPARRTRPARTSL